MATRMVSTLNVPPSIRRRRRILWALSAIVAISTVIIWSFHRPRYLALNSLRENEVSFKVDFPGGYLNNNDRLEIGRNRTILLEGVNPPFPL